MIAIVSLCSLAQVRVATPASSLQKQNVVPYDSIQNRIYGLLPNAKGCIGQELFIIPNATYIKHFYVDYKDVVNSSANTSEISGKVFRVEDAFIHQAKIGAHSDVPRTWIKLASKDYKDTIYFDLSSQREPPYLILGYKKKFEQLIKGRKFVYIASSGFDFVDDFNTGKELKVLAGSIWVFDEIIISTKSNNIEYLFKDNSGNFISKKELSCFITQKDYNKLVKSYGKQMCTTAINKEIVVGMPEELLKIAWGNPDSVNDTSHGETWTYKTYSKTRYVYLRNGKVKSWI